MPNVENDFILETDASRTAVGAVLKQRFADTGLEHPVGFFSRALSGSERNYGAYELEMYAVVRAMEHFRIFLVGKPFLLRTDHAALANLLRRDLPPTSRVERWILRLSEYTFRIEHQPGKDNVIADVLSRLPFASAASEGSEDSTQPTTSSLREERNEKVSEPLRKVPEPQAKGCETFRSETVNFAHDWSYQSLLTTLAPSANSARSADAKKSGIGSIRHAENGEEARFVEKSAEDSDPFSRTSSATLISERLPARNETLIQLNSQYDQGTNNTDRGVPGSEDREMKGSQPLKEVQCNSITALPLSSTEPSAPVEKNSAPQQPDMEPDSYKEIQRGSLLNLPDESISAARVPSFYS